MAAEPGRRSNNSMASYWYLKAVIFSDCYEDARIFSLGWKRFCDSLQPLFDDLNISFIYAFLCSTLAQKFQDWREAYWKYFHVGLCHKSGVSWHEAMSCPGVIPCHDVTHVSHAGHLLPPAKPSYISTSSIQFTHLFEKIEHWIRENRKCYLSIFAVLDVTIDHLDCSCCNHPLILFCH